MLRVSASQCPAETSLAVEERDRERAHSRCTQNSRHERGQVSSRATAGQMSIDDLRAREAGTPTLLVLLPSDEVTHDLLLLPERTN